jgi:hypothetical protein
VDLNALRLRVAAVEAAAGDGAVQHARVVHELDRLAEHLVGQTAAEAQDIKGQIQNLIIRVAPERHDVVLYLDIYCNGGHP